MIVTKAMAMPIVSVNREAFLYNTLMPYVRSQETLQKAIEGNLTDYISKEVIDEAAKACIKCRITYVTGLSFATGLPGGPAVLATIPADMVQFYANVFKVVQQVAYLYGYPSFKNDRNAMNPDMEYMLTIFVGGMMCVNEANAIIKRLTPQIAQSMANKMAKTTLTKTALYPVVKQIARQLGFNITKSTFSKSVSKAIPLLGGIISSSLSYYMFNQMSKRLLTLLNQQYTLSHNQKE